MLSYRRPDNLNNETLYVITSVFNPMRYKMRWALYDKFRIMVGQQAPLYTVEIAYGDREFAATQDNNPYHLQLRSNDILWLKERSLNLLERILPRDWKYLAWIDADISFTRSDWVNETLHKLQVHPIVQMWSEAVDLS